LAARCLCDKTESVSALWEFRVAAGFAQTAVQELDPRYLRNYGSVNAESAAAVGARAEECRRAWPSSMRRAMMYSFTWTMADR
jgi:hypothetical protein